MVSKIGAGNLWLGRSGKRWQNDLGWRTELCSPEFSGGNEKGDQVLFYHSVSEKAVVGLAKVETEAFPDPTADDPRWLSVELVPVRDFKDAVTLAQIKADQRLQTIPLIRQSRLSVMPLKPEEFEVILGLGN